MRIGIVPLHTMEWLPKGAAACKSDLAIIDTEHKHRRSEMTIEETTAQFWGIFSKNRDHFGNYPGENAAEAFEKMVDEIGDAGPIEAWEILERIHVDADRHVVTAYHHPFPVDSDEVIECLYECGFDGAAFNERRLDASADGEDVVVLSFLPELV